MIFRAGLNPSLKLLSSLRLWTQLLLLLTGVLLAVMPWTEHFYTGDSFRGGQDIEFGLLGLAAVLGLCLLLPSSTRLRLEGCFGLLHLRLAALRVPRLLVAERVCFRTPLHPCMPPGVPGSMLLQI